MPGGRGVCVSRILNQTLTPEGLPIVQKLDGNAVIGPHMPNSSPQPELIWGGGSHLDPNIVVQACLVWHTQGEGPALQE